MRAPIFSRGSPTGDVISDQKALRVSFGHYGVTFEWIFRNFQGNPLRVTFDDVTSSEKAPLGQILRNFPLRMRTPSTPSGSRDLRDLRSLPVVMVLVLLYYILYYYYSSSTKCTGCACTCHHFRFCGGPLPVMWLSVTSLPVTWITSLPVRADHVTSGRSVLIYYSSIYFLKTYSQKRKPRQ